MDVVDVITNIGFPAGVAAFALWNSYKHEEFLQGTIATALKENTAAINELRLLISKMTKEDDGDA